VKYYSKFGNYIFLSYFCVMNIVSSRLLNQQLIAPQFSRPEEVVSYFGAMQAQEYRLMRWAVAMRTKRPTIEAFRKAFDKGDIIRTHLLRGTWQLISGNDYWWMMKLLVPRARAVIGGWMKSNDISIPDDEYASIREIIVATASEKHSVTKEDFVVALSDKGIVMDDHRLSYHIRMSELDEVLCSGDLHPMKATYSLVSNKLGTPIEFDRDESLRLLAQKYFQSHAPATIEDYLWWSGLNLNDCKKGITLLGDKMKTFKQKGREFYLLDSCRTRGFHKDSVQLLPSYDEYLIGYKSRDIVLSPLYKHKAHNNSGIFYPIVLKDGVVCGNWSPFAKDVSYTLFEENTDVEIAKEWDRYIGYTKVNR